MFSQVMAPKVNCASSTLLRLVQKGKIQGEKVINQKTGHWVVDISTPVDEVRALLDKEAPRHGYKKTGKTNGAPRTFKSGGAFLQTVIEWRAIPEAKRKTLLDLSKLSLAELRLLLDLAKS